MKKFTETEIDDFIKKNDIKDAERFKKLISENNVDLSKLTICDNTESDFESISDFKFSVIHGTEVNFIWAGKMWGIFANMENPDTHEIEILVCECCYEKDGKFYNPESHTLWDENNDKYYKTADEALEYTIGDDRLRDIITKVEVVDRTI
jgi:hypothetical protein